MGCDLGAANGHEINVVDRAVAIAVDKVDETIADAVNGRNVQFHRPDLAMEGAGAEIQGAVIGRSRILHPERHGADRGPMHAGEGLGEAVRLCVKNKIDIALAVKGHALGAVPGDGRETHVFEEGA